MFSVNEKIEITKNALEKNNIECFLAEDICKAKELVSSIIEKGSVVSFGGSMTLKDSGILELFKTKDYTLLDRNAEGADVNKIFRDSFSADYYLCGTNAITQNGELYNVDGLGNRVTALTFGPKNVIIVAGVNKIVKNLDEAIYRVKTIAAPLNCKRLNKNTYCATNGKCACLSKQNPQMTDGCQSADRICRHYVVTAKQAKMGRIKVVLVNESLGY